MIKCHTAPDTLVAQVAVAITPKLNPYGMIAIISILNYSSMSKTIYPLIDSIDIVNRLVMLTQTTGSGAVQRT